MCSSSHPEIPTSSRYTHNKVHPAYTVQYIIMLQLLAPAVCNNLMLNDGRECVLFCEVVKIMHTVPECIGLIMIQACILLLSHVQGGWVLLRDVHYNVALAVRIVAAAGARSDIRPNTTFAIWMTAHKDHRDSLPSLIAGTGACILTEPPAVRKAKVLAKMGQWDIIHHMLHHLTVALCSLGYVCVCVCV